MGSAGDSTKTFDVIVVGGGFSGIYQLRTLREAGFNVRMIESGAALGGIWYWNCYPGARVDTAVPCYQFTADDSWQTWDWQQRFPGRDEIQSYMQHLDEVWDLSKDVSYNSRVTAMDWDDNAKQWNTTVEGDAAGTFHSKFVILSTGFASKLYIPPYKDLDTFRGELHHTGVWPQSGVNLKGKRVAVIGTGASGVQLIQNAGRDASHLTVFQRTPNTAIPMVNPQVDDEWNQRMKDNYADTKEKVKKTFAGFDYEFADGLASTKTKEERMELYEKLFNTGECSDCFLCVSIFPFRAIWAELYPHSHASSFPECFKRARERFFEWLQMVAYALQRQVSRSLSSPVTKGRFVGFAPRMVAYGLFLRAFH
jgi:cation diffusion facilitator CzcD-associated flavoprotein CzcO